MAQQSIVRTAKGLFTNFNRMEVPPGALLLAENSVIDRPGVIERRRGFDRFGTAPSNVPSTLMKFPRYYRNLILDGTTLKYDSDGAGTWSSLSGTYTATGSYGVKAQEFQQSLYFTTTAGVQKLSTLTGTPARSGIPEGLDVAVTKSGTGNSWFLGDSQVSHRILFGRTDANGQEYVGEPSYREVTTNTKVLSLTYSISYIGPHWRVLVVHNGNTYSDNDYIEVTNSTWSPANGTWQIVIYSGNSYYFNINVDPGVTTTGTCDVSKEHDCTVVATIPSEMLAGDWVELYRTVPSASASTVPDDRHRKLIRYTLTSTDISNGYATITDNYTEYYEDLYTNPLVETDLKKNSRPPRCSVLASWKGHLWYGDTAHPHYKDLQLVSISGIVSYPTASPDSITIGSYGTWTFATAEDVANKRFLLDSTSSTTVEKIRNTMKSLCKMINRAKVGIIAWYTSGSEEEAGKIRIQRNDLTDTSFALTTTANMDNKWDPDLPTSGTTISSAADPKKNGLFRSKFEKPEAVPLTSFDYIGDTDYKIVALLAIKDALLIYKEDGLWMMSGDSDGSTGEAFTLSSLDPTIRCIAPNSAVVLDNAGWTVTAQGLIRSTESGSKIISWPIDTDIEKISRFTNFNTVTYGIGYESAHKYLLLTQEVAADATPKVIWVFNYINETWTRWRRNVTQGLVMQESTGLEYLYLVNQPDKYVLKERKTTATTDADFSDEAYTITISANGTATDSDGNTVQTVTFTFTTDTPAEGWLVTQGATDAYIVSVSGAGPYVATLDTNPGFTNTTATLTRPIQVDLQYVTDYGGNAASLKQFPEAQYYLLEDKGGHYLGFCSDLQTSTTWTTQIKRASYLGSGGVLRSWVPRTHQIGRGMNLYYRNKRAKEKVAILQYALSTNPLSEVTTGLPR